MVVAVGADVSADTAEVVFTEEDAACVVAAGAEVAEEGESARLSPIPKFLRMFFALSLLIRRNFGGDVLFNFQNPVPVI